MGLFGNGAVMRAWHDNIESRRGSCIPEEECHGLLDSKGLEVLLQGAGPLLYGIRLPRVGGAAKTSKKPLALLDKVQGRAMRLIRDKRCRAGNHDLHSLQHRRDVAGLTVMYRLHQQRVPHLHTLRQPLRRARLLQGRLLYKKPPQSYYSPDVVLGTTSVSSSVSTLLVECSPCLADHGHDSTTVQEFQGTCERVAAR
ncbi:hypothetical protein GWK47_046178 [Chionoecetes opilio]|uniref:Uncharacterized protein n=1 Tax=Chionoecetes opilio TaxID=41210 RepID=A0A8J4Y6P8_CHIOP|nr:hypothetical protein GWK47_046178 [Chionoecetes opilio]